MKIRFVKRAKYRVVNPKDHRDYAAGELSYVEKVYEEGKTYDLDEDHARRWLRRGLAEEVVGGRAAPEPEVREVKVPEAEPRAARVK